MESEINLKNVSEQKNYVRWMFEIIKPYLGKDVLEVGAGTGAFTNLLEENGIPVLAVDKRNYDVNYSSKEIKILDITKPSRELNRKFDTIVCTSVLEHVEDDNQALRNMSELLSENGKLILIVPVCKRIFGPIDRANGHHRRYSKKEILVKLNKSGYEVVDQRYINFVGLIGWIYQNKILKSRLHRNIDLKRFDRFCPFFQKIESLFPPPIGLSLFLVAKNEKY